MNKVLLAFAMILLGLFTVQPLMADHPQQEGKGASVQGQNKVKACCAEAKKQMMDKLCDSCKAANAKKGKKGKKSRKSKMVKMCADCSAQMGPVECKHSRKAANKGEKKAKKSSKKSSKKAAAKVENNEEKKGIFSNTWNRTEGNQYSHDMRGDDRLKAYKAGHDRSWRR